MNESPGMAETGSDENESLINQGLIIWTIKTWHLNCDRTARD